MSDIKILDSKVLNNSGVLNILVKAYKECMPLLNIEMIENKILKNQHLVNKDFEVNPKFILAFNLDDMLIKGRIDICTIFVYEEYRNNGIAKELVNNIKKIAINGYVIQAAVYFEKFNELKGFYESLNFSTTGYETQTDLVGARYVDYFWCNDEIRLTFLGNETRVDRINIKNTRRF